jgi:hypothetical protein
VKKKVFAQKNDGMDKLKKVRSGIRSLLFMSVV